VLALPLTSPDKFAATADKLLRERSGFALRSEEPRGEAKAVVFSRAGADGKAAPGPRVAYAIVRGYGLLARGNDPAAEIGTAAQRVPAQSLAAEARWTSARELLKPERGPAGDVLLFAPAGSALGSRVAGRPLGGDTALALAFQPQSLQLRLRAALPKAEHEQLQALLPGGGGELLALLPSQAPLVARLGLKPAEVAPQLERVALLRQALAALRAEASSRGGDLDKDLFGALKPGLVAALGVAPTLQLSRAVDFGLSFDWRVQSPFDSVQLAALAEVADKPRLLKALDAVAQALPKVGAQAVRSGDDWQITYAAGAGARFGVREAGGRAIAYLVGGGIAPESLGQQAQAPIDAALQGPAGLSVALDLGKLAAALRALPDSTYGAGPQSYIARSLVGQVVEPLKSLRGSLQLQPTQQGLQATASLEIVAAPGSAQQNRPP
jgi:hypothetical protein